MENIEKQVIEWHNKQFLLSTVEDIANKFEEEYGEFDLAEFETGSYFSNESIEEFTDMCIVFIAGLAKLGKPSLAKHIARKLEINKNRKWNKDGSRNK